MSGGLQKQNGFTLIELIMTLVILGILAVVALGRLDLFSSFAQQGTYDKLKAGLEFARKAAVAQRRYVCVAVDGAAGTVTFTVDTRAPEGPTFCDGTSEVAMALPAPDADCGGASNRICSHAGAAIGLVSGGSFAFDAQGGASSTVVLSVAGMPNVTVAATTGYVY